MCVFHAVESMFSAMCECQALHPDPEDDDSDNDFEGEEYDLDEAGEKKPWRMHNKMYIQVMDACVLLLLS